MAIETKENHEFMDGEHLVVNFGLYEHHGIYCGDGQVIHFGRGIFDYENAIVEIVDLDVFSKGSAIKPRLSVAAFHPQEIVSRAHGRLGDRGYDLVENNCEHFVSWCRCGTHESHQVSLSESIVRQTSAVASRPLLRRWAASATHTRLGALTAGLARGPAIVAGVADVLQSSVEVAAIKRGKSRIESEKIGKRVGLASSAVLGLAVGGPATACAGVGYWLVGQLIADHALNMGKQAISVATEQLALAQSSARCG